MWPHRKTSDGIKSGELADRGHVSNLDIIRCPKFNLWFLERCEQGYHPAGTIGTWVTKGNGWVVGEELCVNSCHPVLHSAAASDFLTESAHRLVWPSLKCISYVSDGRRGSLAALAAAVPPEVIANSPLSQEICLQSAKLSFDMALSWLWNAFGTFVVSKWLALFQSRIVQLLLFVLIPRIHDCY